METAASWVQSIVDFILGPEAATKTANIMMTIGDIAKAIINFLQDPATATKNVILSVTAKMAEGVKKIWDYLTGSTSDFDVDINGNVIIKPKAGDGLTSSGSGASMTWSLTDDINATASVTPAKSNNWQSEWDELVGDGIQAKVKLKQGWTGTPQEELKINGLATTVSAGLSKNWGNKTPQSALGVDSLSTTVSAGLSKNWGNKTPQSALGVDSLSTTVSAGLSKNWGNKTPQSALGLEGLSATVAIGVSLVWAAVGILAYLALTDLKTNVTVGLVKGWTGSDGTTTALSALGIAALSTTVKVTLVKGWTGDNGDTTAIEALGLNKLKTTVSVGLKKNWSKTPLQHLSISKLKTTVKVGIKRGWNGQPLNYLGIGNLATSVTVRLKKGSPNKIEVSKDGDTKWELSVKKLGGVFAKGIWKSLPQFANGGIFSSGLWRSLPKYASGTTNAHGSMFIAGEAGPELVGHVGGRTEVLNQSQLAATMFSAVRAAMGGVKIAATMYNGGGDNDEADYEMMYRAMYDAFTDAMAGSNERDREKIALMRQIAAKEFTAEVTAASVNRAQTRMNRRAGTTIVPVGT